MRMFLIILFAVVSCGVEPNNSIIVVTNLATISSDCYGTVLNSVDNCRVTIEIECLENGGYISKSSGVADWALDGLTGNSIVQISIYDPYGYMKCLSTYDVTYKRI